MKVLFQLTLYTTIQQYNCVHRCAAQCFDAAGAPRITAVFGCRKKYHYKIPDPLENSAHWMGCIYDKIKPRQVVLLCTLNAIKEGKQVSPEYMQLGVFLPFSPSLLITQYMYMITIPQLNTSFLLRLEIHSCFVLIGLLNDVS